MEKPEPPAFAEPAIREDQHLVEKHDQSLDLIVPSVCTAGSAANAPADDATECSFCKVDVNQVESLIAAGPNQAMCADCTRRFYQLVEKLPGISESGGDEVLHSSVSDSRVDWTSPADAASTSGGEREAMEPGAGRQALPVLPASSPMFANSPPLLFSAWGTQVVAPPVQRPGKPAKPERVSMTDSQLKVLNIISIATICSVVLLIFYHFITSVGEMAHTKPEDASYLLSLLQNGFNINIDWPTTNLPSWASFVRNGNNMDQVLRVLPLAWFASFVAIAVSAVAVYYTRPRDISCDDRNLILEGSGPLMIGVRWKAIKQISQSRTWDIFNGKRDVLTVETMGGHTFRMRVSDIARRQDIGTFFNKVRTNAPNAVLHIADEIRNAEPSYTELWLKYFSAPSERTKKGLLEPGMALDSGRYTILQTVGGGGQGTAYLAVGKAPITRLDETCEHIVDGAEGEITNGMEVVLKEYVLPVHRGQLTAEKTAQKLKAEAAILRKLDHPQIVKLLDGFIEDYRGYLVLEYVQGETLKSLVDRLGPQPEQAVIGWASQIANILTYLHSLTPSVVHRDITPDNLILQEDGTIKVVDFNVAHQVDSSATATVVGKHAYIPPEQFRGKPNEQSDIYALGGTMFFLLTGSEPEPISVARPRRECAHVSEKMDALVSKCTALDLTRRFADARELLDALQKLMV